MTETFWIRTLNALMIFVLMGVLSGAYYMQYVKHEEPCPLCILQRAAMIGIALGAVLNLRFGVRPIHYGLSLVSAFFGGAASLRQIALHICPGSPVFGVPVFGLSLYTWAFLVFCSSVFAIVVFLFFYAPEEEEYLPMNFFEKVACWIVFGLVLMNLFTTLGECGFGLCKDV